MYQQKTLNRLERFYRRLKDSIQDWNQRKSQSRCSDKASIQEETLYSARVTLSVGFYNPLCNSFVTGKNKYSLLGLKNMEQMCNPTYGRVDELLSLLTKSKSLHTLMILDRKKNPARFSELKILVDSSSTTVARRLNELELHGLVSQTQLTNSEHGFEYSITEDARTLSPILQSIFEWVDERSHDSI